MEDFASLVLEVDSSPVSRSTSVLDTFAGAADGAGSAAARLTGTMKLAAGAGQLVEDSIVRANQRLAEMAQQEEAARREAAALAAAQRAAAAEMQRLQAQASAYRAVLDPLTAAQSRLADETERVQKLVALRMLTEQEGAQVIARSTQVYETTRERLSRLGDTTQVTAGQLTNLRYQAFDAFNMLATGAPISSVLMSQFGGVAQALGDGPGGVGGTLTALGQKAAQVGRAVVSAIGPWNLAFVAATAAAYGLYRVFREEAKPVEDALKRQETAILALEKAYDLSGEAAERYMKRSKAGLEGSADAALRENQATLRANVRDKRQDFYGSLGALFGNSPEMREFRAQVDAFYESVNAGNPKLAEFDAYLRNLQKSTDSRAVRQYADDFLTFNETLQPLIGSLQRTEDGLKANELAAQRAAEKIRTLNKEMGQYLPPDRSPAQDIERIYQERMAELAKTRGSSPRAVEGAAERFKRERNDALRELDRQSLEDLMDAEGRRADITKSSVDRQIAEIDRRYDRQLADARRTKKTATEIANIEATAEQERQTVREQAARDEAARRENYDLDVRAITARTAAQKAEIAAERAAAEARQQNLGDEVAAARAAEARNLSLAESREAASRSAQQLTDSTNRRIDQMQLEMRLVGASVGEAARLRAEFELLAQAKDQAKAQGFNEATVELTEEMKAQAAAIGETTAAMERLNFERDVAFRLAQTGRSPQDQRIAEELRSQGIEFESTEGKKRAAILRTVEATERAADSMRDVREAGRDAFKELITSIGQTNSILDTLVSAFAGLGNQLAEAGFDKLFGGLLGGSDGSRSSLPSVSLGGAGGTQSTSGVHVGTTSVTTSAPSPSYPYSDKYALPEVKSAVKSVGSAGGELANAIRKSAQTLGVSANDIATVISYETAGSFDAWKRGPTTKWGQHVGYIQMGEPQRAKYGYTQSGSVDEKMQSVTRYLLDAGVKAGHGLLEIYSAINAGGIGEKYYNRRDAAAGGAPGTVRDKVNYQMEGHKAKGAALLGTEYEAKKVISEGTAQGSRMGLKAAVQENAATVGGGGVGGGGAQKTGLGQAFDVLGAGLGIFSAGYQSGSPLGGGVQGALGGFQVGSSLSFLGAAGGPIGAVAGAAIGILGGVLGGRKQREQQHKQAAAEWEKVRPQYEAFDRSLSGEGVGNLRASIQGMWSQLSSFMEVGGKAWKNGTGNSTAQFNSTGLKMMEKWFSEVREFQESYETTLEDLNSGQGLQGAFATGRANVKKLDEQIKGFIDDVNIAFGSPDIGIYVDPAFVAEMEKNNAERERQVERSKRAAGEYTLTMLYTGVVTSDVAKAVDSFRGTAAGIVPILTRLGWSAEEAARAVNERLTMALDDMRSSFERDVGDRLNDLRGKSYLTEVRDMLKEFDQLTADASLIGANQSDFGEIFRLQAQKIVDGAELSGDAFTELVAAFPRLSGVVREFTSSAIDASAEAIRTAISGYEDRLNAVADAGNEVAALERRLARERLEAAQYGATALAAFDRAAAAERTAALKNQARETLDRSYQAETDRLNDLISARQQEASELESTVGSLKNFLASLDNFKKSMLVDDNLSVLDPEKRLEEARRQFLDLSAKAAAGDEDARNQLAGAGQEYLTEARDFYASSEGYYRAFYEVQATLSSAEATSKSQLTNSQSQLDALKRQIEQSQALLEQNRKEYEELVGINAGIKDLAVAMREFAAASAAAAAAAAAATKPTTTAGQPATGANYDAPRRPGLDVSSESAAYLAKNGDVAAAIRAGETFGLPPGMAPEVYASAHYGLHGQSEGRKWRNGGWTGSGDPNKIAGFTHHREFVFDEASTAAIGVPALQSAMRNRSLQGVLPISRSSAGGSGATETVEALLREILGAVTDAGERVAGATHGEGDATRAVLAQAAAATAKNGRIADMDR